MVKLNSQIYTTDEIVKMFSREQLIKAVNEIVCYDVRDMAKCSDNKIQMAEFLMNDLDAIMQASDNDEFLDVINFIKESNNI